MGSNKKIIDTHAHFLNDELGFDSEEIKRNLNTNGTIFHIAWNIESSEKIIELHKTYNDLLPIVGIHPSHVEEYKIEDARKRLSTILKQNKVFAIGEIGVDLFHVQDNLALQKDFFIMQLELAQEFNLPVVLHIRDAYDEAIEVLKQFSGLKILVHSWNSNTIDLNKYLDLPHNTFFGINGMITFKNAKNLLESVSSIPLEKLVLETDMPYLAPVPYRGKRNQSEYITEVAKKLSEILKIELEELVSILNKNAKEFYELS